MQREACACNQIMLTSIQEACATARDEHGRTEVAALTRDFDEMNEASSVKEELDFAALAEETRAASTAGL